MRSHCPHRREIRPALRPGTNKRAGAGLVLAGLVLCGCAARSRNWRLTGTTLVPPGVRSASVARASFTFPAGASCAESAHGIKIQTRGKKLRVSVNRDELARAPAGWVSAWATSLSARGCMAAEATPLLAERIDESVPLDPHVARDLLHASPGTTGWIDLARGDRLRVISPVLRESAPPGASVIAGGEKVSGTGTTLNIEAKASVDFLGYETDEYVIGRRITLLAATMHAGGKESPLAAPRVNYFRFDERDAYFREFFLTRVSAADHDIAVLAAPSPAELDALTKRFNADPSLCRPGDCVLIPSDVAVTPLTVISVNGASIAVPIGASLFAAIQAAKAEQVLPTLSVRRPHAGRLAPVSFDRNTPAVLSIPLKGGEEIRW